MPMCHFHQYTYTALSAAYGTVYTCPMGRLQHWCMYLVVRDAVLVIIMIIIVQGHIETHAILFDIHAWTASLTTPALYSHERIIRYCKLAVGLKFLDSYCICCN